MPDRRLHPRAPHGRTANHARPLRGRTGGSRREPDEARRLPAVLGEPAHGWRCVRRRPVPVPPAMTGSTSSSEARGGDPRRPLLAWKPDYALGIPAVDHEHRELFDLVNDSPCEPLRARLRSDRDGLPRRAVLEDLQSLRPRGEADARRAVHRASRPQGGPRAAARRDPGT